MSFRIKYCRLLSLSYLSFTLHYYHFICYDGDEKSQFYFIGFVDEDGLSKVNKENIIAHN